MTAPLFPPGPAQLSFEVVYAIGLPFLHQALRWLGVARVDLDDMLQEVFLAAHRGLGAYEPWRYHGVPSDTPAVDVSSPLRIAPETALKRWLFGIAWRKVSHYHERAHRRREIPSGAGAFWRSDEHDPAPTPEQATAGADRTRLLSALLSTIAPARRVILVMHDLLEIPAAEIARELAIKENTVRSRLRLAREDFRAAAARQTRERRSALLHPFASERPLDALVASLLRAAREIPAVPAPAARALWARLQRRLGEPGALLAELRRGGSGTAHP